MPSSDKKRNTRCPIAYSLDAVGDRWSLIIVRDMMMRDFRTYSEFLDGDEGVATNVLAGRLKDLEADGIIEKTRDPGNRRSYRYSLTAKGCDLAPVIMNMIQWGAKYDPLTKAKKPFVRQLQRDPEKFMDEIRKRFLGE